MRSRTVRSLLTGWLAIATALGLITASCTDDRSPDTASTAPGLVITALSTRADTVTDHDVLIGISGMSGTAETPTVTVGGAEVDATPTKVGDEWRVLVNGLAAGENTIRAADGDREAQLTVIDHPKSGPVFSGPQLDMPLCTTTNFGLTDATPPLCDAPSKVTFRYIDTAGAYHVLADPTALPADIGTATMPAGTKVPFVLRTETGVINRGIYELTALDPAPGTGSWDSSDWNRRLVYRFGGGCGSSYSQGFDLLGDTDPDVFEQGYATATSTFTTFQVNCNDVLSAETAMMVKEHFAESWGLPELTIGEGGSGGAIQQLLIVQNYPGILDAIAPTLPFPDAVSISGGVVDCALLNRFYASSDGTSFTNAQQVAVNGHLTTGTCTFWDQTFARAIDPSSCGLGDAVNAAQGAIPGLGKGMPIAPKEKIYDPVTNPTGLRCTLQDTNVNIYGRDPATGFARRPWDNVGVQYGLAALNSGAISVDQFLDLNAKVGSFDIDGQPRSDRVGADEGSIRVSYESGRVNEGGGDLRKIPVILVNIYTDPLGDIHDRFRAFSIRDRLRNDDGTDPPNYAIWTRGLPPGKSLIDSLSGAISLGLQLIGTVDEWATAVKADTSDATVEEKLATHRPKLAVDACFEPDGTEIASGAGLYDQPGPCVDPYPIKGDPRTVAGEARRGDIVKCQLQPTTAASYDVPFTDGQRTRLATIFSSGVCDWTKPGIGQVPLGEPWRSFG